MSANSAAVPSAAASTSFGRFKIVHALGRGAQGSVYLADDPRLQRQVAIKSIGAGATAEQIARQLQEARVVSQFSHPNIVTLYDAIEADGGHFLILEYVDGETLAQLLRREGRLEPQRALRLAIQIAEGLAYAHAKQVIHRDIKPANIMIDASGTARIMDFGIAAAAGDAADDDIMGTPGCIMGTPGYMAPECLRNEAPTAAADVFAAGMVLYEMLVGGPAVTGANTFEIIHKISNEPFAPPSRRNENLDEEIDHLVMRAIGKSAGERYASAAAMKQAMEQYLAPAEVETQTSGSGKGALDFLLRRMSHKTGFPALSQTISAINRIAAKSDESVQTLSAVLLKDFALTNKLLRLVNSTTYRQFGGGVSTISRAVMILGFNTVRDLAITLILFEHLQNRPQASQIKEEAITAYFTGIMAHRVAGMCGLPDREEGFICGVFQHLGKLLASYYFYEEAVEITKRVQNGEPEDKAARTVLGITLEELGIEIARSWSLPEKIIQSMESVGDTATGKPHNTGDRLKLAANLAKSLCRVASETKPERKAAELERLNHQFGNGLKLGQKQLSAAVEDSVKEFLAESAMFVPGAGKSRVLNAITVWSGEKPAAPVAEGAEGAPLSTLINPAARGDPDTVDGFVNRTIAMDAASPAIDAVDAVTTLTAGIQDITNTLVSEFNLNDVLRIILETIYRGMGFSQVLLCTRDGRTNRLQARFGFGARIESMLKDFAVPLDKPQDVFQLAVTKNVDLFIADTHADNIINRIPAWYHEKINAPTFLLLPIVIAGKPVGLFYADRNEGGALHIEPEQLRLLKTLRNQAILAIRQKF